MGLRQTDSANTHHFLVKSTLRQSDGLRQTDSANTHHFLVKSTLRQSDGLRQTDSANTHHFLVTATKFSFSPVLISFTSNRLYADVDQ